MNLNLGIANVTPGVLRGTAPELPAVVTLRGAFGTVGKLNDGVCVPLR
jgi:hypothetical protein